MTEAGTDPDPAGYCRNCRESQSAAPGENCEDCGEELITPEHAMGLYESEKDGAREMGHERDRELSTNGDTPADNGETDSPDKPYYETTLDTDDILVDCPGCQEPMLLGEIWRDLIDDETIDEPPACPDCEPEEWSDDADPKVSGAEVVALTQSD